MSFWKIGGTGLVADLHGRPKPEAADTKPRFCVLVGGQARKVLLPKTSFCKIGETGLVADLHGWPKPEAADTKPRFCVLVAGGSSQEDLTT